MAFGFAPPLQSRLGPIHRGQQPATPMPAVDPFAGTAPPKPQLPALPAQPYAGPSAMSHIPDMAPIAVPAGPSGAGIEDPSAAVSDASANVAAGMPSPGGASPEGMDIGALLSALFGA